MKITNGIVFGIALAAGPGNLSAGNGVYNAKIGWDGGDYPSAMNFKFQGT